MKKYRIVKTEKDCYVIQKSILFGLFWKLALEPIASYNEYNHGYVFYANSLFFYNSISDAEESISIMKKGKRFFYRKNVIKPMRTTNYNLLSKYEYRYFVKPIFADVYKTSFSIFDDAKNYIDKIYEEREECKKKYKVKEIVKYC